MISSNNFLPTQFQIQYIALLLNPNKIMTSFWADFALPATLSIDERKKIHYFFDNLQHSLLDYHSYMIIIQTLLLCVLNKTQKLINFCRYQKTENTYSEKFKCLP